MKKKLISLITVLCMLGTYLGTALPAFALTTGTTNIYSNDFEDEVLIWRNCYTERTFIAGNGATTDAEIAASAPGAEGGNKVLKLTKSIATDANQNKLMAALAPMTITSYTDAGANEAKQLVWNADFYLPDSAVSFLPQRSEKTSTPPDMRLHFSPQIVQEGKIWNTADFLGINRLGFFKGFEDELLYGDTWLNGPCIPVTTNEWHKYTAVFDLSEWKFSIYIDGVPVMTAVTVKSGSPWETTNRSFDVMQMQGIMIAYAANNNAVSVGDENPAIYIDNVEYYQANTAPSASVAFDEETKIGTITFDTPLPDSQQSLISVKNADNSAIDLTSPLTFAPDGLSATFGAGNMALGAQGKVVIAAGAYDAFYQQFSWSGDLELLFTNGEAPREDVIIDIYKNDFQESDDIYNHYSVKSIVDDAVAQMLNNDAENKALKIEKNGSSQLHVNLSPVSAWATSPAKYSDYNAVNGKQIVWDVDFYLPQSAVDTLSDDHTEYGQVNIMLKFAPTLSILKGGTLRDFCENCLGFFKQYDTNKVVYGRAQSGNGYGYEIIPEKWYNYKAVLDLEAWTYSIYIDGNPVQLLSNETSVNLPAYDSITADNRNVESLSMYGVAVAYNASGSNNADSQSTLTESHNPVVYVDNVHYYQVGSPAGVTSVSAEYNGATAEIAVDFNTNVTEVELEKLTISEENGAPLPYGAITGIRLAQNGHVVYLTVQTGSSGIERGGKYTLTLPAGFRDIHGQYLTAEVNIPFEMNKSTSIYVDESETNITAEPNASGVTVSVNLKNYSDSADAMVILAAYAGDKMLLGADVQYPTVANITDDPDGETLMFTINTDLTGAAEIKLFVWDNNLSPYQSSELIWLSNN